MIAMAPITDPTPAPTTATSRIDSSTGGNAIQISTSREIDRVDPAAIPAGEQAERGAEQPRRGWRRRRRRSARRASRRSRARARRGRDRRCRANSRARRRRSRAAASTPRIRSCSSGSFGAIHGAPSASTSRKRMKPPPTTTLGSRDAGAQSHPIALRSSLVGQAPAASTMAQPRIGRDDEQIDDHVDDDEQRAERPASGPGSAAGRD